LNQQYYKNNAASLLNIKPSIASNVAVIIFIFVMIFCMFFSKMEIYDIKTMVGVLNKENKTLAITQYLNDSGSINGENLLRVDNRVVDYEVLEISDVQIDYNINQNYQIIVIKLSDNCDDWFNGQILQIVLRMNKEPVIKKFWKKIMEE